MIRGIYTSASGMTSQIKKQETIADNLANVNTSAFKKSTTVMEQGKEFEIFRQEAQVDKKDLKKKSKLTKIGKLGTGVKVAENYLDFEQGGMKQTDNSLDFALEGNGFFSFETNNGIRYSREGSLNVDRDGYIVNNNGDRLIGYDIEGKLGYVQAEENFKILDNGALSNAIVDTEVAINGLDAEFAFNPEDIFSDGDNVFVAQFEDSKMLSREGSTYYIADLENAKFAEDLKIHQGFLENSNVNTVKEMVELINCSRSYETNQKVLSSQNDALDKTVNEIGKWT
jgi:flagellar basal-body rod protein FlgG